MKKTIYLFCFSLMLSFKVVAGPEISSLFNFKFLDSFSQNREITVDGEQISQPNFLTPEIKKAAAIYRSQPIPAAGEVFVSFDNNHLGTENKPHEITAYKLNPLSETRLQKEPLIAVIEEYCEILKKQYPYRFVTKKRSCKGQQSEFFQCLYNEKETWDILFFVNNGQIILNLMPVVDEKNGNVIGGAFIMTYKITGKRLDWTQPEINTIQDTMKKNKLMSGWIN